MIIDNLPSDFTVGSEESSDLENAKLQASSDSEELSDDMGDVPDEEFNIGSDDSSEIEMEDDGETGDIEFGLEDSDIDEEIEVDDTEVDESDDGFEEIEFESDSDTDDESVSKVKTVGDYLKKLNNTDTKEVEEEETVENLYKKIGYKTGYFESLNIDNAFRRL